MTEVMNSTLERVIQNYSKEINTYKENYPNTSINLQDVYKRIGLGFFHGCLAKGLKPSQIPSVSEILPYKKLLNVV